MSQTIRSFVLGLALMGGAAIVPTTAHAQDTPCEILRADALVLLINEIDGHISEFNLDLAKQRAEETRQRLPCLVEPLNPGLFTRFARQQALLGFFSQDEERAVKWGMAARYGLAQYPWPPDMGEDHPVRETIGFAEEPMEVKNEEKVLVPPKKGGFLLNGQLITEVVGREGIPAILQVLDKDGKVVGGHWVTGASYPDKYLEDPGKPPDLPKFAEDIAWDTQALIAEGETMYAEGAHIYIPEVKAPDPEPVTVAPKPEPEAPKEVIPDLPVDLALETLPPREVDWKEESGWIVAEATGDTAEQEAMMASLEGDETSTDLSGEDLSGLIGDGGGGGGGSLEVNITRAAIGGGLAVVAGALYGAAAASQAGVPNATTEEQLIGARSRTNILVFGSGLAGAAAVGVGVTALISTEGSAGLGFTGTW